MYPCHQLCGQIEKVLHSPFYPRTRTNPGPKMLFLVLKTDDLRNQTSEELFQ